MAISYQQKIIDLEIKIRDYINFGWFFYKPLGYKKIRIRKYELKEEKQKVNLILETKEGENLFEVNFDQMDNFFNHLLTHEPRNLEIKIEKKTQSYLYENVKLGFTKDYLLFKYNKKNSNSKEDYFKYSINKYNNISPIIVFKRKDNFLQIIHGKKRFKYLMDNQKEIMYLDVTSLLNSEIELNEDFLIKTDILFNNKNLKESWDELARYYLPSYKMIDLFIKNNNIEQYINKFQFILILEPDIQKILRGEAIFDLNKIQRLWEEIKEYYNIKGSIQFKEEKFEGGIDINLRSQIFKYLKQNSKFYNKQIKKEEIKQQKQYWFNDKIVNFISNPNNFDLIEELELKGNYYNLIFKRNLENKIFFKEIYITEEKDFVKLNIGSNLIFNVDNILQFINENQILFEEILKSKISIDLTEILLEVLSERIELLNNDFNSPLFIIKNEKEKFIEEYKKLLFNYSNNQNIDPETLDNTLE